MSSPGKIFLLLALFLIGTVAARAHDPQQASTNIWLRPDKMEVEVILSRAPVRLLLENAPKTPITEDNFESVYLPLLKPVAPKMLDITLDGQSLAPSLTEVSLFEETDIRFTYVYPRPDSGRLRVTANFLKRMGEGYGNSVGMNEDRKVLGYGDQDMENPSWEVTLGKNTGLTPPSELSPPPPPVPGLKSAATANASNTAEKNASDSYFIIPHFHFLTLAGLAVIILLALWRIWQKS